MRSEAARELRVAVVGGGWMGEAHLRAYAAQPAVRIVALVTRSPERGAELSARYPVAAVLTDAARMIDELRPDGISVTTREHEHLQPTCHALERGVGVLVEKPMATSPADAARMADVAARTGAILVPGHVLRFALPYQALRREVTSGRLGRILGIAARRDRHRGIAERYDHVHPALLTAVHDIDLVLWLTGSGVRRVRALEVRRPGRRQPDLVWGQLELDGGAIAAVSTAMLHPADGARGVSDRIEVYGEEGVGVVDLSQDVVAIHARSSAPPDWLLEPPDGTGAFGAEIAHFCRCLRERRASDVISPAEAVAGIRVADAMIRSATADGSVIEL